MKNLYIIIAIAALATLSSCRKTEYENPDVESRKLAISVATTDFETEDPAAADSAMQILQRAFGGGGLPTTGDENRAITRAGDTTFEYKDSIGIYIHTTTPLARAGIHSPNMLYTTYNAETWHAQGPLSDILKSGTTYYATAYHPYVFRIIDPTVITHSVAPDQSTPLALSQSDLMHTPATAVTNPTTSPTIALAFKHLLAKVVVTFAVPAMLDGQAVTGVDRVLIKSVDRTAVVNLSSGAITTPSNKGDIKMRHIDGLIVAGRELTYEAIVIPQTIATGTKFIEIYFTTAAGQRNYIYNIEKELTLTRNLKHSRTLVSIGDLCFSSVLDLTDGLAKTKLPLKIKGLKGVAWALTSTEEWMTLCATADGDYGISITGIGTGAEQTVYVNVAANTTMEGDFWEPRTARLDLASKGVSSYYTARQNFYRFDLVNSAQMVSPTRSVVGVEGFGANQVWSAASGAAWIKLGKSVVYGQGDPKASYGPHNGSLASSTLFYQIEANNSDTTRSGTVIFTPTTAGGKGASVTIEQAAAAVRVSHTSVVLSASAAAGVEVFTVNAPVGVSWKILSASGVASTSPAVGAVQTGVGLPISVRATYGANGGAAVSGQIVVAYGDYGAAQQTTVAVTQSVASVKISGLLWATGNLVANGANGARIGSPTDGGVYFQFGSLIGWNGGSSGSGVGTSVNRAPVTIATKPSTYSATPVYEACPYYAGGTTVADLVPFATDGGASAIGDPCRYYLGGTWRLPINIEYSALYSDVANATVWASCATGDWVTAPARGAWGGPGAKSANAATAIFFPASGHRSASGAPSDVGTGGYGWSSSIGSSSHGYHLSFSSSLIYPRSSLSRAIGFPVRCVQDAPTEPVPPAANQTITIDGLKWTTGNLVANGPANVKVGAPADDGLYFKFGSLVGWSGGADGSGVGIGSPALALRVRPTAYTGTSVYTTCGYYSAGTSGTIPSTDVATTGIGDACRYYLGGTWRLPAAEEFKALCNNVDNFTDLALANAAWQASPAGVNFNNSGTKLFIPASGLRYSANGGFGYVGTTGYCWSGSVYDATFGYLMNFNNLHVHPQSAYSRRDGYPVRCVDGVFIAIDTSEWKSVVVAGASLDVTVRVESASGWTASVPATTGFTASPLSGKSGDKIKLTWASNATAAAPARSATVTFTATAGGVTKTTTLVTEQVASAPPVNPPTDAQTVTVGGIKWTTGNLVAVSGKTNECKIGAPLDGGLYFQFGSLLGWKGGATGDGTGRSNKTNNTFYVGSSFNAANEIHVKPALFTAIATIGTTFPYQKGNNLYYFGYTTAPYSTAGQSLRAFTGYATGTLAASGVGDPCTYYLGSPWRQPTNLDWQALYSASTSTTYPGSWSNGSTTSYLQMVVGGKTMQIPSSGLRHTDGSMTNVGASGYYWSESVYGADDGDGLSFRSGNVNPQLYSSRCGGFPVRCVQDIPTVPTPPTADQIVTIGGLKWTTGNLIAADGANCKVGAPLDGGLYFQFGSLLGWKGGASGDGTGVCTITSSTFFGGATFNATNEIAVKPALFTAIGTIGTTWPNQSVNLYYFGLSSYATNYAKLRDFTGFTAGTLAASGVGDPCRYYLGGTWRLPTAEEYKTMCNNYGGGSAPGSANAAWTTSPTAGMNFNNNSTKLFIPASGYHFMSDGSINGVGTHGHCWSESVYGADHGYTLYFVNGSVNPQGASYRRYGFPVRCVSN